MFQAQGKNNFDDVKNITVQHGWEVYRVPNNSHKFIFKNDAGEVRVLNWTKTLQILHDSIQKSVADFIHTHTTPYTATANVDIDATEKPKKEKKKIVSSKSKIVVDLEEKIVNTTLKLMNTRLKRGSDEHMELRSMLHSYHEQLSDLGIKRGFCAEMLTREEMHEARKRGEEKKKERREKRLEKIVTKRPKHVAPKEEVQEDV